MNAPNELRYRNPFREATSSELIENPDTYSRMFSPAILVNETLEVFERSNIVLTGPQGTGKSMILCLFRHSFLSACLAKEGATDTLPNLSPFISISVNLVRSCFHVFGRRSVSRTRFGAKVDHNVDAMCAADFLNHFLFRQLLRYFDYLTTEDGAALQSWLRLDLRQADLDSLAKRMSKWPCWRGYYQSFTSLKGLMRRCEKRLMAWGDFLDTTTDDIPEEVWVSKVRLEEPLHRMGEIVADLSGAKTRRRLPLYVVVDQYEVLPELNIDYGTTLQRVINSLIKARDPFVFYKIGARPYDWGKELRVWGAESRIEQDRDYKIVNLTDILRRQENQGGWLFPVFAEDVAHKRMQVLSDEAGFRRGYIRKKLGGWDAEEEAREYLGRKSSRMRGVMKGVPPVVAAAIERRCKKARAVLDMRLAAAWASQQNQGGATEEKILQHIARRPPPWQEPWWRKERVEIALLQVASILNQRKKYYGWNTVLYLAGADIRAFLRICEEIWEIAAKIDPRMLIDDKPLPPEIQTEGIFEASHRWRLRDRTESSGGGSRRYAVISRLGPAIHDVLIGDLAISNPGHSGFSVRDPDLFSSAKGGLVAEFLGNGLNWAIFEERLHTSKQRDGATRSKWFLHPILSPAFGIPLKRVKEPFYTSVDNLYEWFFENAKIHFGSQLRRRRRTRPSNSHQQLRLPFESDE